MNNETEIVSQLKARLQRGVPWGKVVEECIAAFGHLNPTDIAGIENDQLWKLWTATKFAETGTPSLPNPTPEQWPGIRKMTQLLCDRNQPLGERFVNTRAVYRETFSAEQVQPPVILRTLLILEGGRFGTVATKSHLDPLLKWAGKPEMDYRNPASITNALENVLAIIEAWSAKVGSVSPGDRACIPWHLCEIIQDNLPTPEASTVLSTLPQTFEAILNQYLAARTSAPFAGSHPVCQLFENLKTAFSQIPAIKNRSNLRIKFGVGKGNWAGVPWIAFLDQRETKTTMDGVYSVYLFCQDMSGVYLTLNQGVSEIIKKLGRQQGRAALRNRASIIRPSTTNLAIQGFSLQDDIDLKADLAAR